MIAGLAIRTGISPRELRELPTADLEAMGRVIARQAQAARQARRRGR